MLKKNENLGLNKNGILIVNTSVIKLKNFSRLVFIKDYVKFYLGTVS